jgi:hypothetical protein
MTRRVLLLVVLFALGPTAAGAVEFCADLQAKYGSAIIRCIDFAAPTEAGINWARNGQPVISSHLFDGAVSATGTQTGSLHWKITSYDQMKAENPSWSNGHVWAEAMNSHGGAWQRWIGRHYTPGQTYYFQFKYRFNSAFKTWWGGGGPKVWGLDAGCRVVSGQAIPPVCEQTTGTRVTDLGTATSMETATMTTMNWFPASVATAANRPYPILYQGSSNFGLTQGLTPTVPSSRYGTAPMEQPGFDSGWSWNGVKMVNTCNSLDRFYNPDFVSAPGGPCVTYGAPDVWHEITIALRPSSHYYDTNPAVTNKSLRHDTLLKVWYDGRLFLNFDPDERAFRKGQPSAAACAALQTLHPSYDDCHTGIDLFVDSRDLPLDCATQQPSRTGRCGSSYPIAPAPWLAGDPGADPSQFILWTFSYRRGYPTQAWCDAVIGPSDQPYYNQCSAFAGSADDAAHFDAFLHHREVNVYMDDWVVSAEPPPMKKRPTGSRLGTGSFGFDARDLHMPTSNRWARLHPGPDQTFSNAGYGRILSGDPVSPSANGTALVYIGVSTIGGVR